MCPQDLLYTIKPSRITERTQFWETDKDLNIKKMHKYVL